MPALAVFIPLPKLAVCHTQYSSCEKCEKCVSQRIEPTASCTKCTIYLLGQNDWILQSCREMVKKWYETRLTYPGTQGTLSTQSTPHPRVKVTPAGRGPCELGWELRDPARFKFPIPDSRFPDSSSRFKFPIPDSACREY